MNTIKDQKVIEGLLNGEWLCDHVGNSIVVTESGGLSIAVCTRCQLAGPPGTDYYEALVNFWIKVAVTRNHYIKLLVKEKQMYVPSDPHDAYKMGVRDGTKPLYTETGSIAYRPTEINNALAARYNTLLPAKKVTMWINVYRKDFSDPMGTTYTAGCLHESKALALALVHTEGASTYVGTSPVEIEIPA